MLSDDATDADRSSRRVTAQAIEVTRRRRAWVAAREEAQRLKADYDAAVVVFDAVIGFETMSPPPPSEPEGEG
jgi:hypothetical protein